MTETGATPPAPSIQHVRQILEPLAQGCAPALGDHREFLIVRLYAGADAEVEGVGGDHRQVEWHADRQVGAQGRIHRHQHGLGRVLQTGFAGDDPIQDRLAIFMLADLEEGRVLGRFDEIAGRIDEVEARFAALALARDHDRRAGAGAAHLDAFAIFALHRAHRVAHNLRHAMHRVAIEDGFDIGVELRFLDRLAQHRLHPLGDGQIARTE